MALFNECTQLCAHILLDMADIVRDGDFSPTDTPIHQLEGRAILFHMIPLPKPRGFWDYALFALAVTGALLLFFWLEASDRVGWADAALAFAAAVLFVLAIILTRRREKAAWILHPNWLVYLMATLGALVLMFAAVYADAYLLHRKDVSTHRLQRDVAIAVAVTAATLWSSGRRAAKRRLS
jgi:hypothetical protein